MACIFVFICLSLKKNIQFGRPEDFLKKENVFLGLKGRLAFVGILHWVGNESGQCYESSVIKKIIPTTNQNQVQTAC